MSGGECLPPRPRTCICTDCGIATEPPSPPGMDRVGSRSRVMILDSASASHRTPAASLPHQSELHGGSVAVPQSVQMQALSTRHGLSPAMDRGQVQIHAIRSMSRVYTSAVHRTPATSLRHQSELHGDSVAADHNSVQMQVRGRGGRHSPFDMASPPVARGGPGRV